MEPEDLVQEVVAFFAGVCEGEADMFEHVVGLARQKVALGFSSLKAAYTSRFKAAYTRRFKAAYTSRDLPSLQTCPLFRPPN